MNTSYPPEGPVKELGELATLVSNGSDSKAVVEKTSYCIACLRAQHGPAPETAMSSVGHGAAPLDNNQVASRLREHALALQAVGATDTSSAEWKSRLAELWPLLLNVLHQWVARK